ncbi:MFS transporter [Siculibacillus lacustris]|uniref:MFS transporter n=1 Tax=Siculibacillus lacustris TaxID=1549641 RepID=A0A4Q9VXJ3_9HYPH|nr:MFS transporter [Siculibacillus lacustris]TBW40647.1 MFS transporter [Siculibacillus lacustris]
MPSTRFAAALARRHVHYGWIVAATTFLTMLATAGAMGAPGVLIVPFQKEFGWANADISTALAVRLVLFGLMGPFAAAFLNRFGLRRVVATALAFIALGVGGSLVMTQLWQMVLLWGVVIGLGTGMTALVLGATVATRWFEHRRGLVVGLLTASNATGQLVFLPLLAELTERFGWRSALTLVVVVLIATMGLVLLLMRDRPEDLGLVAFGADPAATPVAAPASPRPGLASLALAPLATLASASRNATFRILFATFFVCGFSTNGLIQTHWITLCGDYGIAPVGASGMLAAIGVCDFFGTILSGWLSDRFDNRWLLFWYYGLRGLSLIYLPLTDFSVVALAPFAVFYGLDWVATVPPTVRLAADAFGREKAGMTFGWIFAGHQLGAAAAAFSAGTVRTDFETYLPVLFAAGALCGLAALLALTIERPPAAVLAPAPAAE